ncbi:MAG: DinB family protein [Dehalococcoidia bacterium]
MTLLPHLYRHHKWANLALIDHLAGLPDEDLQRRAPGGFGTIHETLFHMLANEGRFIDTLSGKELVFNPLPAELPPCSTLRQWAETQGDQLIDYAKTLTEDSRLSGTFKGEAFNMPLYVPLFQAYNHGVEHRTNITSVLATYDIPTPGLDLWSFMDAGEAP